jgi:glycosyltransferase involved in cell wall biosynthesis
MNLSNRGNDLFSRRPDERDACRVEILLSTYDGSRYLDALFDSIARQSFSAWALTVRDDGSCDGTPEIIDRWRERLPGRIRRTGEDTPSHIGAMRSFSRLLSASSAPYVMFADQDDVWLPDKVKLTYEAMRAAESAEGTGRPTLVHTDLTMVDERLQILSKSFWTYQGLSPPRRGKLPRLMMENIVWGCTAMLNRALVDKVGELPGELPHHDWWIALVAAAFGEIVSLSERPIFWRRHAQSTSVISGVADLQRLALADIRAARPRLRRALTESRERVSVFLDRYGDQLQTEQLAATKAFLDLPERGFLHRRLDILRRGFLFGSLIRNAGLLALV